MEPVLEVINIDKSFVGVHACDHISFQCYPGRVHVLQGENGAGKSTVLKMISGLYKPDSGEIRIKGEPVIFAHPQDARQKGIAMVYQEMTIFPELTVAQNIFINREETCSKNRNGLIDEVAMLNQTVELAEKYGIDVDPYQRAGDLPIAQQQMIEILKALATDPDILILDEPTATLTTAEVNKLYVIVQDLLKMGKAIIFISHRMGEVFKFGHEMTILRDGQLTATVELKDVTENDVIRLMVGRELQNIFPPKAKKVEGEIFQLENFGDEKKVKGINLLIKKGEVLGISALDGQGQTELFEAIAGVRRHSGKVTLNGRELRYGSVKGAQQQGIDYVPEDRKGKGLCLNLSVGENLALNSLPRRATAGFIHLRQEAETIAKYVKAMNIKTPYAAQFVENLSGGNQQKVSIGKNLADEPKLLLLNEPTRGIDVEAKQEIYKLIRNLADKGVGILMYTSDMMEVIGLSDRVMTMYEGHLTGEFTGPDINEMSIIQGVMNLKKRKEAENDPRKKSETSAGICS